MKVNILTGGHKRMAFVLCTEIQNLARDFGIEKLGFLTLTFADKILDIRQAQKRFNSLNTGVIRERYRRAIGVWERQKSGRIHFHLVVVLASDIRTGFDFQALDRRDYRSANLTLRAEWSFWRKTAPLYRFGRTELLPVRSTAEGIARYVGKYVSKHIAERTLEDKGARVVRFIGFKPGDRRASARFAWNTDNSWLWRQKLRSFCESQGVRDTDALARIYGPRWAYRLQETILACEVLGPVVWPSLDCLNRTRGAEEKQAIAAWRMREHSPASPVEIKSSGETAPGQTHEVEGRGPVDTLQPATLKSKFP